MDRLTDPWILLEASVIVREKMTRGWWWRWWILL